MHICLPTLIHYDSATSCYNKGYNYIWNTVVQRITNSSNLKQKTSQLTQTQSRNNGEDFKQQFTWQSTHDAFGFPSFGPTAQPHQWLLGDWQSVETGGQYVWSLMSSPFLRRVCFRRRRAPCAFLHTFCTLTCLHTVLRVGGRAGRAGTPIDHVISYFHRLLRERGRASVRHPCASPNVHYMLSPLSRMHFIYT